jgi:ubiquinone/menaquinone biosynthesis C-methylase UbiE
MNADSSSSNPSIYYYDSDYPSAELSRFPENFDETTKYQGLAFDVDRYKEIASHVGGPILELCCGTGRVAIPLARRGFEVTGVDISPEMLETFQHREPSTISSKLTLVRQDITELDLGGLRFPLAIIPFNSLLLITDFAAQCGALRTIAGHLSEGGLLVMDLVNPLDLPILGNSNPKPFFTRRNVHNGNRYTRFAMIGPFDESHRQLLHGWYDEVDSEGCVKRQYYSIYWRPIFRFEAELMLKEAGLEIVSIEGGHLKEPYTAQSPRMFIQAKRLS